MRLHEFALAEASGSPFNAAFWRWFGDSKVVDRNGDPLPVYHGTREVFDRFDPSLAGAVGDRFADATFFTNDPLVASGYAGSWMDNDEFVTAREDAATKASRRPADIFVVFRPEQIKSIFNAGAWNPADARISEGRLHPRNPVGD